jgi:hypothetical protein
MRKLIYIAILLSVICTLWSSPITSQAQEGMWVEVLNSHIVLTKAIDDSCYFGNTYNVYLNLPGECGRPTNAKNKYMIYGHSFSCDSIMCHYSREAVDTSVWASLIIGDTVRLFDGNRLWSGRVIEVIHAANEHSILPQDEFPCSSGVCGTLTVCADLKPAYTVVRIVYK